MSKRRKDEVVWTEEGRTRLARANQWDVFHHGTDDEAPLRGLIVRATERLRPAWIAGSERSDAEGRAAVPYVSEALAAGGLPDDATVDHAAWAASLLGAVGDVMGPLVELLLRQRGVRFCLAVLVRMGALHTTNHHLPDGLAISMALPDEWQLHHWGHGGKGCFARYLLRSYRAATPSTRTEMVAAVEELWPSAPPHVWAPLTVAISDAERAQRVARTLLAFPKRGPQPSSAFDNLSRLVTDARLARTLCARGDAFPDLRLLENLGAGALPIYDAFLAKGNAVEELLGQLCNVRGPRTARIMARYAEQRPTSTLVHNYFADSPELLIGLRGDRTLDHYRLGLLEQRLRLARLGWSKATR